MPRWLLPFHLGFFKVFCPCGVNYGSRGNRTRNCASIFESHISPHLVISPSSRLLLTYTIYALLSSTHSKENNAWQRTSLQGFIFCYLTTTPRLCYRSPKSQLDLLNFDINVSVTVRTMCQDPDPQAGVAEETFSDGDSAYSESL